MKERKESGLTIKMYCEDKGIASNTYFYWQRKLQEAACQQMIEDKQNVTERSIAKRTERESESYSPIPLGWAVCREAEENRIGRGISIEIGCSRISVSNDADLELLKKVCRMLTEL